jgi:hypothetical protein
LKDSERKKEKKRNGHYIGSTASVYIHIIFSGSEEEGEEEEERGEM